MPTLDQFREFMAAQAKATEGPYALRPDVLDDIGVVKRPDGKRIASFCTSDLLDEWQPRPEPFTEEDLTGPPQVAANATLFILARTLPLAEWLAERERMVQLLADARAKMQDAGWHKSTWAEIDEALGEQGAGE